MANTSLGWEGTSGQVICCFKENVWIWSVKIYTQLPTNYVPDYLLDVFNEAID